MLHYHAVVWLDHAEAHVMHISPDDVEKSVVHPAQPHRQLHHKSGIPGDGRTPEDQHYYHAIVEALKGASEILIAGPAQAKLHLLKHIQEHDQAMIHQVVALEAVDHPTDGQLLAYARKYFERKDRML